MQVVVDGLMTHYEQAGRRGKQLLLVHGWGDRLETYNQLVERLQPHYRTTRLDLPGFGATEPPKEVWGLSDYAGYLKAFVDKLGLRPDVIIGHSNGGAVAIVAVADGLLAPKKLVLLASAGVRNRQKGRKLLWKMTAKTGKAATIWLPKRQRQRLQKKFYGTIGSDLLVAPHLQETFKRTVAEDITTKATQLTAPTLLVYGDQDTATPISGVGEPLHKAIAGSILRIIPSSDHFVHQQVPDQVAAMIEEFAR